MNRFPKGNDEYHAHRGLEGKGGGMCQMFPSVTLILSAGWKGFKILPSVSISADPVVYSYQEILYSRVFISNNTNIVQ